MQHICGQCQKGFETEKKYLEHNCDVTGFKPTDPRHLGEGFAKISEAALKRGNERAKLEKEGKNSEDAIKETRDIGKSIA